MSYLLDSDWIISFLNGRPDAVRLVDEIADEGIAISVISWGEVREGLLRRPDSTARTADLRDLARTLSVIRVDIDIAERYADIRRSLRAEGLLLEDNDLWIAATAISKQQPWSVETSTSSASLD